MLSLKIISFANSVTLIASKAAAPPSQILRIYGTMSASSLIGSDEAYVQLVLVISVRKIRICMPSELDTCEYMHECECHLTAMILQSTN